MVHPWGSVNSRWDPKDAPLGYPLGFYEFAVGTQWFTFGVL